jgi:adenine/guanine phosphoribosyltransferase-like PRPP-binding protein
MSKDITCSHWFKVVFDNNKLRTMVRKLSPEVIKFQKELEFEAIAFSGISGALVAPIISYETGIPIIMVRKKDDYKSSHDPYLVSGCLSCEKYVILDDLVNTGKTVLRIKDIIWENSTVPKLVGIILYSPLYGYFLENTENSFIKKFAKGSMDEGLQNLPILAMY